MFLLRETERSVTDVCLDVGFTTLGTFSRTFRAIIGETTSEYRRGHEPIDVPHCFHMAATRPRLAAGVAIQDVRALYETLRTRGVTDFTQEPTDHFYGTDMGVHDPFLNAIRILQQGNVVKEARPDPRPHDALSRSAS